MIETSPSTPARVDMVLPCLDGAETLPWVLDRIPAGRRAIVVGNGSTDGSADIARGLGAYVVHEPRRGFGAACHARLTAAAAAAAAAADVVCFCDCDATLDPASLPVVAGPVLGGSADLEPARLIRRRTGPRLHDLGPMRAARHKALPTLDLTDRRSGYPLRMVIRAAGACRRVTETDMPYHPRTGRSKVTGTWRGTWQAVRDMRAVLGEPPVTAPAVTATTVPGAGR